MKKLNKKYRNQIISNGVITKPFNTNEISDVNINYYIRSGFGYLFEDVCIKCENVKCVCDKVVVKKKKK